MLHGFGFAGALSEVGLPQHAIPLALLFFNLGVEVGHPRCSLDPVSVSGLRVLRPPRRARTAHVVPLRPVQAGEIADQSANDLE